MRAKFSPRSTCDELNKAIISMERKLEIGQYNPGSVSLSLTIAADTARTWAKLKYAKWLFRNCP